MSTKTPLCLYCKKRHVEDYGALTKPFCAKCDALKGSEWTFCVAVGCEVWAVNRLAAEYRASTCSLHGGQTFRGGKHP